MMKIQAFGVFLLVWVCASPARADLVFISAESCPAEDLRLEALRLLEQVEPIYDAIEEVGEAPEFRETRSTVLRNGDYRTSNGWTVDAECLGADTTPADIEAALSRLKDGVNGCRRFRMLAETHAKFDRVFKKRIRIQCDSGRCSESSVACARGTRKINFKVSDYIKDERIWFHELLHLARGVDNQTSERHNTPDETESFDEVYLWQNICFDPAKVLTNMREGDLDACRRPLGYSPRMFRRTHAPKVVDKVCGLFENYLEKEKKFSELVERELLSKVGECASDDAMICARQKRNNLEKYYILSGGHLPNFPSYASQGKSEKPLTDALALCGRSAPSAGTPLCETFHKKIKGPMSELLGYWR